MLQETKHAEIREGQTNLQVVSGKNPMQCAGIQIRRSVSFLRWSGLSSCGSVASVISAWIQECPEVGVAVSSFISTKLNKRPDTHVASAVDIDPDHERFDP